MSSIQNWINLWLDWNSSAEAYSLVEHVWVSTWPETRWWTLLISSNKEPALMLKAFKLFRFFSALFSNIFYLCNQALFVPILTENFSKFRFSFIQLISKIKTSVWFILWRISSKSLANKVSVSDPAPVDKKSSRFVSFLCRLGRLSGDESLSMISKISYQVSNLACDLSVRLCFGLETISLRWNSCF